MIPHRLNKRPFDCFRILSAVTFLGIAASLAATMLSLASGPALGQSIAGQCPQPRFTGKAPDDYYDRKNPLQPTAENLAAGERLYQGGSAAEACAICHGKTGDGKGLLSSQYSPPPRNFTCARTINDVPDGQLFWIVRFGSPGTAMPPHPKLSDEQIWQVVLHLRRLAK